MGLARPRAFPIQIILRVVGAASGGARPLNNPALNHGDGDFFRPPQNSTTPRSKRGPSRPLWIRGLLRGAKFLRRLRPGGAAGLVRLVVGFGWGGGGWLRKCVLRGPFHENLTSSGNLNAVRGVQTMQPGVDSTGYPSCAGGCRRAPSAGWRTIESRFHSVGGVFGPPTSTIEGRAISCSRRSRGGSAASEAASERRRGTAAADADGVGPPRLNEPIGESSRCTP